MSIDSLITQALFLTTILMLPQHAKLNIKRKNQEEEEEVKEEKQEMEEAVEKNVNIVVIYGSEYPVQGHSGKIFWHPRYPERRV